MHPLDYSAIVTKSARKHCGRGLDYPDLVGEGWVGLMTAWSRHRGELDQALAKTCVHAAIRTALRRNRWIAINKTALARARRGADDETARAARAAFALVGRDRKPLDDQIAFEQPADAEELPAKYLDCLDPLEAAVLGLRLGLSGGDGVSLADVGRELGLGKHQVHYLERRALKKLRARFTKGSP